MEQCLKALEGILDDLATSPAAAGMDRTLSCRLTDLGHVVQGRLADGAVQDVHTVPDGEQEAPADIRFTMTSDDLIELTEGRLDFAPAWASGRVKLEASFKDLLRLRKML